MESTLPRDNSRIAQAVQKAFNLPPGLKLLGPTGFPAGMNQTDSRLFIDDRELYYLENYIRIGNGRIRTLWDVSAPFFTDPSHRTIVSFYWYNIGTNFYVAIFYSDGTADQVVNQSLTLPISTTPGTFYQGSGTPLPACCQSGSGYLLIGNNNTPNDYWIWNGSVLFGAGGLAPTTTLTASGQGYTSQPTFTVQTTGAGTGATFHAVIDPDGTIGLVDVTNPGLGFDSTDFAIVTVSGGGSDSQAVATPVLSAGGGVTGVVMTNPGSGYTFAATAAFTGGGGSGATGTVSISNGQITGVTILTTGVGYTSAPALNISDPGYGSGAAHVSGGSGAAGTVQVGTNGIASITVNSGGSGYTSVPEVNIIGDGTKATATATVVAGAVTAITVTNPGEGYTKALVAVIGGNNAANLTVSLMPFGVSGRAIETITGRVFIGPPSLQGRLTNESNQGAFFVSAPGSLTDFATSDGGLLFSTTDRFLRTTYINFRQSNGYLYPIGDSSISVISNIQTTGSPLATTFTYQNIDPQNGTLWRDTCGDFSRTVLFTNPFGVFGLYGGAVTKVSQKVDRIFQNAIFPNTGFPTVGQPVVPSSAVANIFTMKCYITLMTITSILTGQARKHLLIWNERDWCLARLETDLIYIGTQEFNSNISAWGTDGTSLYELFNQPSNMLKSLSTKLYGADQMMMTKQIMAIYLMGHDFSGQGMDFSLTLENETGGWELPAPVFQDWSNFVLGETGVQPPVPPSPGTGLLAARALDVFGQTVGASLFSTSPDFELYNFQMAAADTGPVFG